jgi:hypothetical protein
LLTSKEADKEESDKKDMKKASHLPLGSFFSRLIYQPCAIAETGH